MGLGPFAVSVPIRFGDDFELDPRSQKLCRAGRVLKLERIPTEILVLLIEKNGELVTRDQIISRVWGEGVFLDTDNSINGAIRKIRQVLKDDPETPRFIQTVTGRGYRFIAPVVPMAPPEREDAPVDRTAASDSSPDVAPEPRPSRKVAPWQLASLIGIVVVLIAGLAAYLYNLRSRAQVPGPPTRSMLAVLPFENLTGDPEQEYFSDGLTEEMISQLGDLDPSHLGVIARTSVMHYKHSGEPLDRVGRELGVQYALEGSVRRDSNKVRITAQLIQIKDQAHPPGPQQQQHVLVKQHGHVLLAAGSLPGVPALCRRGSLNHLRTAGRQLNRRLDVPCTQWQDLSQRALVHRKLRQGQQNFNHLGFGEVKS